jgi:peroxiredoxin family protein
MTQPLDPDRDELNRQLAELQQQVAGLRPGPKNQAAIIVFSGELDRLLAVMNIATGAAAMGMRVVLFFTFWGTAALRDPEARTPGKDLMSAMFGWMLPKGQVHTKLSRMDMGGLGTSMMKRLMKRKKTAGLDQLFDMAGKLGVEIRICEMSMGLMGFRREEMIAYPHLEYAGVATFLAEAKESAIQLFV